MPEPEPARILRRPLLSRPALPCLAAALSVLIGCAKSNDAVGTSGDLAQRRAEVISEIERYNAVLTDEGRREKYCAMAISPFTFFRGTDHLFWKDLAGDSRLRKYSSDKTRTFLQGDLHPLNYGSFDNDDGVVIYDLNDFDEVVIADYQMDVWRMAVGLVLAAGDNGGLSARTINEILDAFTEHYLDTAVSYRGNNDERKRVFNLDVAYGRLDEFLTKVTDDGSRKNMLDDWTVVVDGVRRYDLSQTGKLAAVDAGVTAAIRDAMASYQTTVAIRLRDRPDYFAVKDIALRLGAGTGSLGVPRYYVLIEGETLEKDDDRILDVKRQGLPSAYPYLGATEQAMLAPFAGNQAQRAIVGYRALAANADDHLGWLVLADGPYSVRERSPYKDEFPVDTLTGKDSFVNMAEQWGAILATAHARSDEDHDPALIGYSFDKQLDLVSDSRHDEIRALVRDVATSYAARARDDYQTFLGHFAATCTPPAAKP